MLYYRLLLYCNLLFIAVFCYYSISIILQTLIYYGVLLLQHFYDIVKSYLLQFFIILQTFIITTFYYFNFFTII
ncbi:hypothetical protein E5F40_15755 [Clostridioides difficile]|nr:hypothetical protein E5F40_15755 [Clostridioides difficile]